MSIVKNYLDLNPRPRTRCLTKNASNVNNERRFQGNHLDEIADI